MILLTETWFRTEAQALQFELPNYTHYYNYRTDIKGGGVSAYVHNDLRHNLSESKYVEGNNYLWIQLDKYALEVGVVYNPGDTDFKKFLEEYESQLEHRKRAIVFGDFNIDLLNKDKKKTRQYKQLLKQSGHKIINKITKKHCTRHGVSKKSILDHVSTNLTNDTFHMIVVESSISDHKQIYLEIKKTKPPPKKYSQYEAINYNKLAESVEKMIQTEKIEDYTTLENKIKKCTEANRVLKTKILNEPQKDWINKHIITEINERNILWTELKNKPDDDELKENFQKKRNRVTNLIQDEKKKFYYKEFDKYSNKPKKIWNLINTLSTNKLKQRSVPSKLLVDSNEITNPIDICDKFNEYFSTIGSSLASKIPKMYHDNYTTALPQISSAKADLKTLDPCTIKEILSIINSLDSNCSVGLDGISTKVIKCIKYLIVTILTDSFNKLLRDGIYPDTMKIAKVTPIYKSGSKLDPGNYRPISVLPVLSKILEKVLHTRLERYLDSINYISERQYGFRPKSNTLTATIDLVTKIKHNIDKKNLVLGIFVDLKKAFDTVSPKLLIKKLDIIGIKDNALQIFESYLSNRSQIVKIDDNAQSGPRPISCGIPQGSILGPLLFLTYINNIHDLDLSGHVTQYADDTCLFYFGPYIHELVKNAQHDLDILFDWLQYNLLTINISKTSYVIFKVKNKPIPTYSPLTINNIPLQLKTHEKYLGLYMDTQLTWHEHRKHIKSKLISLCGTLRNSIPCIPRQYRLKIYNALVKPHLLYLIEIWGSSPKTRLNELQVLQNKLIKLLFNYHYLTKTKTIYQETKLMNIKQLYKYNICIFVRKTLDNKLHTNLRFERKKVGHPCTRRASYLVLPKHRTNYGKTMMTNAGARIFNQLPSDLKNVSSFTAFKRRLNQHVLADKSLL